MINALLSESILNQIEKGMESYSHASNVTSKLKNFIISDPSGVESIKKNDFSDHKVASLGGVRLKFWRLWLLKYEGYSFLVQKSVWRSS